MGRETSWAQFFKVKTAIGNNGFLKFKLNIIRKFKKYWLKMDKLKNYCAFQQKNSLKMFNLPKIEAWNLLKFNTNNSFETQTQGERQR